MKSKTEITTKEVGHRNPVPSGWVTQYASKQIRSFKNSGVLDYRNAVMIMLLHTPLLFNWVREIHPVTHQCDNADTSLLCAFYRLITFYWHGDASQDTHETHMEQVWKKLCKTTWSIVNVHHRQDPRHFMKAFFAQLEEEMKGNEARCAELQRFFRVGLKRRRTCESCTEELPVEERRLFLNASFRERIPFGEAPLYKVAEAIDHHSPFGSPFEWTCEDCKKPGQINSSIAPILSTRHIKHLPEVLFVQVDHIDQSQRVAGQLKIKDTLTIPADWQDPSIPDKQDVHYELYSVIFHYTITMNADKDINGFSIMNDDWDVCAVKEPTNKWALVKSNSVENGLTLDQLLGIVYKNEKKHRACVLAYRRLPLNGEHLKPKNDSIVLVKQTIYIREGVEWTFHKRLPFPHGIDHLIKLKAKARTHRAKFSVVLTSATTGEILEGEANISLTPRKRKRAEAPAAMAKKCGRLLKSRKVAKSSDVAKASATPGPSEAAGTTTRCSKKRGVASSKQATKSRPAKTSKSSDTKDSNSGGEMESAKAATMKASTSKRVGDSTPKKAEDSNPEDGNVPSTVRISPTPPAVLNQSQAYPDGTQNTSSNQDAQSSGADVSKPPNGGDGKQSSPRIS